MYIQQITFKPNILIDCLVLALQSFDRRETVSKVKTEEGDQQLGSWHSTLLEGTTTLRYFTAHYAVHYGNT
jgi:hypothetical protein